MLKIIHAPRTDELQQGDAVVWSNGEVYVLHHTEEIEDSEYLRVYWDSGTFHTTAQPWNTWSAAVRSA